MNKGQVDYAERIALAILDEWNDVVGFFTPGESYYGEITSIVEDAVHCGIQTAIFGDIKKDDDGNVVRRRLEE